MSKIHWERYYSPAFDITRAVKVGENLGRTVLFARYKGHNEDWFKSYSFGDFIVGEDFPHLCIADGIQFHGVQSMEVQS